MSLLSILNNRETASENFSRLTRKIRVQGEIENKSILMWANEHSVISPMEKALSMLEDDKAITSITIFLKIVMDSSRLIDLSYEKHLELVNYLNETEFNRTKIIPDKALTAIIDLSHRDTTIANENGLYNLTKEQIEHVLKESS